MGLGDLLDGQPNTSSAGGEEDAKVVLNTVSNMIKFYDSFSADKKIEKIVNSQPHVFDNKEYDEVENVVSKLLLPA